MTETPKVPEIFDVTMRQMFMWKTALKRCGIPVLITTSMKKVNDERFLTIARGVRISDGYSYYLVIRKGEWK